MLKTLQENYAKHTYARLDFLFFFKKIIPLVAVAYILMFIFIGSNVSATATSFFLFIVLLTFVFDAPKYHFFSSFALSIAFLLEPIAAIVLSGGIDSPYIIWLLVPIYAASSLLGNGGTIISSAMAIVFFVVIYFYQIEIQALNELKPVFYKPVYLLSFISAAALMGIFAWRNIFKIEKESYQQQKLRIKAESANNQLLRKEQEQHKLLSIVSHELRTPAATLSMLLDNSKNDLDLPLIKNTMSHLMDVLEDMRMVKEPEIILKTAETTTYIKRTIENAIALVASYTESKKLKIQIHESEDALKLCVVKDKLVRQIAINIIKNCANHSNATALDIYIDAKEKEDIIAFKIIFKDNGQGVDTYKIPTLFAPFVKGDEVSLGSGLGLHLSRSFAREGLNGDLIYVDKKEEGAIFELNIEAKKVLKVVTTPPQIQTESIRLDGLKVLLAEDNLVIALMTQKLLEAKGATVYPAKDGEVALSIYKENHIDFVFTDIFMPKINGYELTKQLRAFGFKGQIIGCSASTMGDEVIKLKESGANKVFAKPIDMNLFLTYVHQSVLDIHNKDVIYLNDYGKNKKEDHM
ncbi:MAG: response regulator [Polaribacter sp.]|jgi:signal transduction histidine kinase/CheY-like chemotaxis protein